MACCVLMALIIGLAISAKSFLFGKAKSQTVEWRLTAKKSPKTKGNINE